MLTAYGVRLRDIRTTEERWVEGQNGERFFTGDRWIADLVAYGLTTAEQWVLPYVVELDLGAEIPS